MRILPSPQHDDLDSIGLRGPTARQKWEKVNIQPHPGADLLQSHWQTGLISDECIVRYIEPQKFDIGHVILSSDRIGNEDSTGSSSTVPVDFLDKCFLMCQINLSRVFVHENCAYGIHGQPPSILLSCLSICRATPHVSEIERKTKERSSPFGKSAPVPPTLFVHVQVIIGVIRQIFTARYPFALPLLLHEIGQQILDKARALYTLDVEFRR